MEGKIKKGYTSVISSQIYSSQPTQRSGDIASTAGEYNELLHLLAKRNRIIEDIKFECKGKKTIQVSRLIKILSM